MHMHAKHVSTVILVALLAFAVPSLGFMHLDSAHASTSVNGILHSDTEWTKAGSPYILTGPVAVDSGVTLTVEAGATVELNDSTFKSTAP